jgi:hypothetical protein
VVGVIIIGGAWSGSATTHFSAVIQRSSHFVALLSLSLNSQVKPLLIYHQLSLYSFLFIFGFKFYAVTLLGWSVSRCRTYVCAGHWPNINIYNYIKLYYIFKLLLV